MVWTDGEIQLQQIISIALRSQNLYEGVDWEKVKEKCGIIRQDFIDYFPSEANSHSHRESECSRGKW